jgi:hypothetical protein
LNRNLGVLINVFGKQADYPFSRVDACDSRS